MFIFASIVLGAGAMLSPALPTTGPRIGLAGALTLAFITAGGIFYACLFGWNTLVIDYMWFAALVGIFLTGTMSAGMYRAEAKGGTKTYTGWPGPREMAFFVLVAIICAAPALTLPAPMGTDAQGFGYLALTLRNSGSLTTLAPFHPEVSWLYSPGFPALVAYLSERLNAGIQTIQFALGAILSIVFVWVAYDLGNELDPEREHESRRLGVAMAVCALVGTGLLTAHLDSHFTAQMALVFCTSFITFAIRFHREGKWQDFAAATITLGAIPLAQPDMTIITALGFVPWLVMMWFAKPRPDLKRWLLLAAGVPLVALLGIGPWLVKIVPLLGGNIQSPFEINTSHLVQAIIYQGPIVVPLAIIGIGLALRRRNAVDLLMLVWLALVIDFSSLGILKALFGGLLAPLLKYDYPFSIAWHGPILPYVYFGGTALLWLVERIGRLRVEKWVRNLSLPAMNVIALLVVIAMSFPQSILDLSKRTPFGMFGAFSSKADIQAMEWLKENTPKDALILNHPGPYEGDWVPVVAQRNTVYFRPQPFFQNTAKVETMQADLRAFWRQPNDPANAALLARYGIQYVIVPQIFTRPDTITTMYRWRLPIPEAASYSVLDSERPPAYLKIVFDRDGAQVYQVR